MKAAIQSTTASRYILVLCTGDSAGSKPAGRVNPGAVRLLERLGLPTECYRSKSWDEFAAADGPRRHRLRLGDGRDMPRLSRRNAQDAPGRHQPYMRR